MTTSGLMVQLQRSYNEAVALAEGLKRAITALDRQKPANSYFSPCSTCTTPAQCAGDDICAKDVD